MKLVIFGASGRTGAELVRQARSRSHDVTAFVRDPKRLTVRLDGLRVVVGDVLDRDAVRSAVDGQDAVLVALNTGRSSDSPWAKLVSPPDLMGRGMENIVCAMKDLGVRRVLTVSAHGVGDSWARTGAVMRLLVRFSNIRVAYVDHERQEAVLRESGLDWTAVRPTMLTNDKLTGKPIARSDRLGSLARISRADTAFFMLEHLTDAHLFDKAPTITW